MVSHSRTNNKENDQKKWLHEEMKKKNTKIQPQRFCHLDANRLNICFVAELLVGTRLNCEYHMHSMQHSIEQCIFLELQKVKKNHLQCTCMRIFSSFGLLISLSLFFACVSFFFLDFVVVLVIYHTSFMLSSDEILHTRYGVWYRYAATMLKGTSVRPKAVGLDSFRNEQSCCLDGFRNIVCHCEPNFDFFLSLYGFVFTFVMVD